MTFNAEILRKRFLFAQFQRQGSKVKIFLPYFRKNDVILDVGCGSGVELLAVSNFCEYAVGLDIDIDALKIARRRVKNKMNIDLVRADALHPPFRSKGFSKIFCFDVLEHLIFPLKLVDLMKNLLCPHGEVILRVPNKYSSHEILLFLISPITKAKGGNWYVRHVSFFDPKKLKFSLNQYKFKYITGYTYGGLSFNLSTILFTLISVFLSIILRDPIKIEHYSSALRKCNSKGRFFEIKTNSSMPSFSYITMMFRLQE
jgi:SAM-dependent methyltransferase